MKIFLSICLIFTILSGVTAESCKVITENSTGTEKYCETTENGSCYFHVTTSNLNDHNKKVIETELGCTTDCAPQYYSFTINETRYFESYRKCCKGYKCAPHVPLMPKRILNGKECRPCFPVFGNECKNNKKIIKCYNHETKCMELLLAFHNKSRPTKNYYGCAAPKFCELAKTGKHEIALQGSIINSTCCDALPN